MSVQTTLPVLHEDATETQWHLKTLQMVNWGGFDGHRRIDFAEGSTLMVGGSGTGKSTILDAFIALLMPSNVPFNGASNEGGGRARGEDQRSLLTYLQGAIAVRDDPETGTSETISLRGGRGRPIWGAIAGTYANTDERLHTILRIYYVKAGATIPSDVQTTYASFDGYFDLERLEPFAAGRFNKQAMRGPLPGLEIYRTFGEFEAKMHARLGIGAGDGGDKAMRLLARLQGGMQVKRVDTLYKTMVLEKPATYACADDALTHFADLEASYAKMEDEAKREEALRRLPELQRELAEAEGDAQMVSQLRIGETGPSPFGLWRVRTERRLLDMAVDANRAAHKEATAENSRAVEAETRLGRRLNEIADLKRESGGGAIEAARQKIGELESAQDKAYSLGIRFEERTQSIGLVLPETVERFQEARDEAKDFFGALEERMGALQSEQDGMRDDELSPLVAELRRLSGEKASLEGRTGMMPRRMHEARVAMARAAGLEPMEDLPFVAELIDVASGEERWRKAVETTLSGLARTVLVDREVREDLSRSIDGIRISPRINFQAVTLAEHVERRGRADHVSGKLLFKESGFSTFIQNRVAQDGFDHLCVHGPGELSGPGARVTPSGQTRNGDRGAHGESSDNDIIGFTNERRLALIEQSLRELDPKISAVNDKIKEIGRRIEGLRTQRDAHQHVLDVDFSDIDHLGIARRIDDVKRDLDRLLAENTDLAELDAEEGRLRPLHDSAVRDRVLSKQSLDDLTKAHGNLVDRQDRVQELIDDLEETQEAQVTEEQQHALDTRLARVAPELDLSGLQSAVRTMEQQFTVTRTSAVRRTQAAKNSMQSMFENFKERWDEHDLGTTAASAEGYREILDRIRAGGLHERRDRWRREFASWSSDDLLQLNEAYDYALDDIEERLQPINRILATLPFGGQGVLQINMRRRVSQDLTDFRRGLRQLSSGLAAEITEGQIAARFHNLRQFMSRIAIPEGKSASTERDRYLDVRQHVSITATCVDEDGSVLATYDSLGGKSGGETQELVAFIVGSALRYQLGDETRSRPRFAQVILDEAFVKADGEFAGRAISAWQKLGFQLLIGTPEGKTGDFERYMDLMLTVVKNTEGRSFVLPLRPVDRAESEAAA